MANSLAERREVFKDVGQYFQKPTQPIPLPILIGRGIGEQRGENKRMLFTLN